MLANVFVTCLLITNVASEGFCNFKDGVFTFEKHFSTHTFNFMKAADKCSVKEDKNPITIKGELFHSHMIIVTCKR